MSSRIFEYFVVCGIGPEIQTLDGEIGYHGTGYKYAASLLDQFPATDHSLYPPPPPQLSTVCTSPIIFYQQQSISCFRSDPIFLSLSLCRIPRYLCRSFLCFGSIHTQLQWSWTTYCEILDAHVGFLRSKSNSLAIHPQIVTLKTVSHIRILTAFSQFFIFFMRKITVFFRRNPTPSEPWMKTCEIVVQCKPLSLCTRLSQKHNLK